MFPANSGFLVNAQTGEHVKSVPVPQYLPEPTLEMIVNAVTGAPKSITRRILVPDVEHYLAERTVCQVSPSKIQRKRLLFPAPKFGKVAAPAKSRKKRRQAVALVQRARCAEPAATRIVACAACLDLTHALVCSLGAATANLEAHFEAGHYSPGMSRREDGRSAEDAQEAALFQHRLEVIADRFTWSP